MTLFAAMAVPIRMAAQQHTRYTITDLGTLGGTFGQASGISNKGSIVGFATLPGDMEGHAFFWSKGVMSDLGTLFGGPNSSAGAPPDDSDEVVGFSETPTPDPLGENFFGVCDFLVC